jgi:H/ACA ribonucleoprotein complex subunit 2
VFERALTLFRVVSKKKESSTKTKKSLCRGVKEVQKGLKKKSGDCVCVFAADVSPVDVISHLPVYCEELGVPYCFVESGIILGEAASMRRPTSVILVQSHEGYREAFEEVHAEVKSIMPVY